MSSRRGLASLTGILSVATLLALVPMTPGCGRKEDPKPPPRKNPARTNDLKVSQRGMELLLTMGYPSTTLGGLALPGIDRVAFARYTRPAPEFMEQPDALIAEAEVEAQAEAEDRAAGEAAERAAEVVADEVAEGAEAAPEELGAEDETIGEGAVSQEEEGLTGEEELGEAEEINPYLQIRVDPEEFRKHAENVLVLEGEDLESAVVGGRIVVRIALSEIQTEPPVAYSFRAQTSVGRLDSPDSNTASFVPLPPPSPPPELSLAAAANGITLTWSAPPGDEEIEGFHVYRRMSRSTVYSEPLATLGPEETEYVDLSARFGSNYVYTVTTVRMKRPVVESALGVERDIAYSDDFAPSAPTDLVLLAEAGRTRLVWASSRERDVVGYLVFVGQEGGDPILLTPEPIRAAEYIHEGTVSGVSYAYTVVAVDTTGNRSKPSKAVTTRAP